MARLIITTPDGKRSERELSGTVVIGRSKDCDLPLPKDVKASRNHCKIEQRGGEFVLSDLGSANGTRLNGEKIGQQIMKLSDGDIVVAGSTHIEFAAAGGAAPAAAAPGSGAGAAVGGLVDKVTGALGGLFGKHKGDAGGGPVFGDKTITCSCGAVLNTGDKSPGQKVGCPRCKKIYVVPGK